MDLTHIKSIEEFDEEIGLSPEAKAVWENLPDELRAMANALFVDTEWDSETAVNTFVAQSLGDMFGWNIF